MAANHTYEQVYNVREDDSLLSQVEDVVCVLIQRGVLVIGYNAARELLTLHYTGYNKNKPVWALDFFEQLFANELLLTRRSKVRAVFICAEKNLVVPDALYDETEAKNWLKRIYFVEPGDVICSAHIDEDSAHYLYAVPVNITELIKINFEKAAVLPLPVYHFSNKPQEQNLYLQCCLTNDQVCTTLHNDGKLLWHKIFDQTCAEDIAYGIKHLCVENNISPAKISLACNAVSAAEYHTVNELSQYFPGIKSGNGLAISSDWDPVISLAQQLIACV